MTTLPVVLFALALVSPAVAQTATYTAEQEAADRRFVSFAQRELALDMHTGNADLQVKNDNLEIEIAKLRHLKPPTRLAADEYLSQQMQDALAISKKLAFAWYGEGGEKLQEQGTPVEADLDAAISGCIGEHNPNTPKPKVAPTLAYVKQRCSKLAKLYDEYAPYPSETQNPPSMFSLDKAEGEPTAAQKLMEEDRRDVLRYTFSSDAKQVKTLLVGAQLRLSLAKSMRLMELTSDSIHKHNAAHPDKLQADVTDIIKSMMEYHQKLASMDDDYRSEVGME